jgi:hypothetical protein
MPHRQPGSRSQCSLALHGVRFIEAFVAVAECRRVGFDNASRYGLSVTEHPLENGAQFRRGVAAHRTNKIKKAAALLSGDSVIPASQLQVQQAR